MSILDSLFGDGFEGQQTLDSVHANLRRIEVLECELAKSEFNNRRLENVNNSLLLKAKPMSDKEQCKIIIDYFIDRAIDVDRERSPNEYREFVHYLNEEYISVNYKRIFMLTLMKMGRPT